MNDPDRFEEVLAAVFKRDDLRGVYPAAMNAQVAALAARAFTELCNRELEEIEKKQPELSVTSTLQGGSSHLGPEPKIAVGYDARLTSPELAEAVYPAILSGGGQPVSLGMVSSEQIYFACGNPLSHFDGGIMVTASHNPAEYNGMKFLHSEAKPVTSEELAWMRQRMLELHAAGTSLRGTSAERLIALDMDEQFADKMLELSKTPQLLPSKPLRILVAAGNGVGAKAFTPIARRLEREGCEFVWQDETPDGHFPHGVPNPLLPEYMLRIGEAVRASGAQLGIGFDGDADRAGFVDEKGCEIIPAQVFAMVVQGRLEEWSSQQKPVVMRNLCCSRLIVDLFGEACEVVDTPVGHGQIKQLMRHPRYSGRLLFAGEHSGHYFYPEFYSVDSGMLTSLAMIRRVQRIAAEGRVLSEELADWRTRYCWSGERNFSLPSKERVYACLQEVWGELQKVQGSQRYEVRTDEAIGLPRVFQHEARYVPEAMRFPDLKVMVDLGESGWWCVLRPSGNEPKLRLNVEAWGKMAQAQCAEITAKIEKMLR